MSGIVEVVQDYLGKPIVLQEAALDRDVSEFEFNWIYGQLNPEAKLAEDINRLASDLLSSYKDKLPSYEISSAVIIQLSLLRIEAEREYAYLRETLREANLFRDSAFRTSLVPLRDLIQAVQAGNIRSHSFHSKLKGYLDDLVEEGLMPSSASLT